MNENKIEDETLIKSHIEVLNQQGYCSKIIFNDVKDYGKQTKIKIHSDDRKLISEKNSINVLLSEKIYTRKLFENLKEIREVATKLINHNSDHVNSKKEKLGELHYELKFMKKDLEEIDRQVKTLKESKESVPIKKTHVISHDSDPIKNTNNSSCLSNISFEKGISQKIFSSELRNSTDKLPNQSIYQRKSENEIKRLIEEKKKKIRSLRSKQEMIEKNINEVKKDLNDKTSLLSRLNTESKMLHCQNEQKDLILKQFNAEEKYRRENEDKKSDLDLSHDFKVQNNFKETSKSHRPRHNCTSDIPRYNDQEGLFSKMKKLFGGNKIYP